MKNSIYTLSFFIVAIALGSCSASQWNRDQQVTVNPLSGSTANSDGSIVYALPRTVFTVNVKMERTIEVPGPYYQYAESLLGLRNAIKSEQEYWSITGVTVNSHEEIDPSELYVLYSNRSMVTNLLTLKKEGLVLDLNPESNASARSLIGSSEINVNQFSSFDLGSDEYYYTQVDTAYRRLSFDSTFISVPYIIERRTPLSVAQLAERAANRLIELREGKILILTGEANVLPSDAAINELNKMEREYAELFTGKSHTETRYYSFHFIPTMEMAGRRVVLFNFSELRGVQEPTSSVGDPVQISLIPEQKLKDMTLLMQGNSSTTENTIQKLFYRVPDVINVAIDFDGERLYNSRKLVYQFGEIIELPSNYIIGK